MENIKKILGMIILMTMIMTAFAQRSPNRSPEGSANQNDLWVGRTHYEDDMILDNFGGYEPEVYQNINPAHGNTSQNGLLAEDYRLYENFPNPFNPSTTIKYTIPESGFVTITVYDISGRDVGTLESSQKQAGTYEIRFDAQGFASGLYFCRISVNGFTDVKKMILTK